MTAEQREAVQCVEMLRNGKVRIWYDDADGHWMAQQGNTYVDLRCTDPWCDGNAIDEAAEAFGVDGDEVVVEPAI